MKGAIVENMYLSHATTCNGLGALNVELYKGNTLPLHYDILIHCQEPIGEAELSSLD